MKIDNSYKTAPPIVPARPQAKPAADTTATAEAVSFSSLASAFQAGDRAPINSSRIQEIKEAIAQGRFKIDPEAVAGRLLDTARDLVNSQRKA
jgi:negative regulator of flagellin synthesis FlgM